MKKKIFYAKANNSKIYVKSYRKLNAFKFFKKVDKSITYNDVSVVDKLDPSIKVVEELYPEFIDVNKTLDNGKYYEMFNHLV